MKYGGRTGRDSSIPTSSMADIAFLLIIFFMVTSVFSATKGLEVKLPHEDLPPDPEPDAAVFIHVQADRIVVDCRPMEKEDILPYLEPRLIRNPNKPVILYTDSEAEYRKMVEVYDLLARTRHEDGQWPFSVDNISIPTRSEIVEYVAMFGVNPMETRCVE